jgi:hypothetical protein
VSLLDGREIVVQLPEHIAHVAYADLERATFDKASVLWRGVFRSDGTFDAVYADRDSLV